MNRNIIRNGKLISASEPTKDTFYFGNIKLDPQTLARIRSLIGEETCQ